MHYMVELAIEREAAILDAALESADDWFDLPPAPTAPAKGRLNPHTRKFSSRATSRRHSAGKAIVSSPKYLN